MGKGKREALELEESNNLKEIDDKGVERWNPPEFGPMAGRLRLRSGSLRSSSSTSVKAWQVSNLAPSAPYN